MLNIFKKNHLTHSLKKRKKMKENIKTAGQFEQVFKNFKYI